MSTVIDQRQKAGAREWGALAVLPAVLLLTLPLNIVDRVIGVRRGDVDVSFGRAIKAAVCVSGMAGIDALEPAVIAGIGRISALLATHWPATGAGRDELPDRPVLL